MTRWHFLIVLGFVCLCASSSLWALDPRKDLTQYMLDYWGAADGLPSRAVVAARQTRDGYLWLGTEEGLVRFDGHTFTVFDAGNTPALRHNNVFGLYESREGALWISTRAGLTVYKDGVFRALGEPEGLASTTLQQLYEDADGRSSSGSGSWKTWSSSGPGTWRRKRTSRRSCC